MKILQINAVYGYGSTGVIVRDLQQFCEERGIECYVAYSLARGVVPKGYRIGSWFSHKLHALLSRIAGKQGYYSWFDTRKFLRYLKKLNPDVVHLHNLHSNYINVNMLLRYLAENDIATVITLHDCWWFTGGCFHYTAAGCNKWLDRCGHCPKRFEDTPAYLYDASAKILADRKKYLSAIKRLTIVGVSSWISKEAGKTFLKDKRIETIYNGVDFNIFKPTPSDIRHKQNLEGKYVILGPASKWLSDINKEVYEYFVKNMTDNMVLVLYGSTQKINVPQNVILYGYTHNREELAELYTMADVFVNPTREDTLPTVNIEAQACGTPVVAFDVCGVKDTVSLSSGDVISADSFKSLLEGIKKVVKKDKPSVDDLLNFVHGKFSAESNYQKYCHLFISMHNSRNE